MISEETLSSCGRGSTIVSRGDEESDSDSAAGWVSTVVTAKTVLVNTCAYNGQMTHLRKAFLAVTTVDHRENASLTNDETSLVRTT